MIASLVAEANGVDPVTIIQAGGTGGLIVALVYAVLAFIRGWVVPGRRHDEEMAKKEAEVAAKDKELRDAQTFVRDQLMPLLTRTQDVLTKTLEERAWEERTRRQ